MPSGDRAYMLFSPPLPPVRLSPDGPIAIGRHPSCELALRRDDISRRHAEIRHGEGGYVLYDLGSTNGTFVNGKSLQGSGQLLRGGDRIELGSAVVTFCEIEASQTALGEATEVGDAKTIVFARLPELEESSDDSADDSAFQGDLAQIPGHAVMQILEMGCQTGLLEIESRNGTSRAWFARGRPVHAETEKHAGFDAALAIVSAESGHFRFQPGEESSESTIQASVTELLLESCRLQDEHENR